MATQSAPTRRRYLRVCRTCGDLYGTVHGDREQLCGCTPDRPPWPGWGAAKAWELCRCCGLRRLESGSRWSVWLCGAYKPRVLELNAAAHACVVPIGRHSLMNHIGLGGRELLDDRAIEALRAQQGCGRNGVALLGSRTKSSKHMFASVGIASDSTEASPDGSAAPRRT